MPNKTGFPSHLRVAVLAGFQIHPNKIYDVLYNRTLYIADGPVLHLMSEYFGFTYEVRTPKGGSLGYRLPNGSWTGTIGMVQQDTCDVAIGGLTPTSDRSEVVDFTFPYYFTEVTFITDQPQFLPKSFAILKPFSLSMWLALAASFVSVCFAFHSLFRRKRHLVTVMLHFFGILLEKSHNLKSGKFGVRLVWLSWVVGALFVINGYKAVLLAFMSFPTLSGVRTIRDLSEAARDPSYKCYSYPKSAIYSSMMMYTDESLARIGECVKRHSLVSVDPHHFLKNSTYRKALILGRSFLAIFKNDFFVSQDYFFVGSVAMAVGKDFCCKQVLDELVHRATAAGLFQKFEKDAEFLSLLNSVSQASKMPDPQRQITLEDLYGVFIILVSGLSLSLVAFVFEVLFGRKCGQRSHLIF